MFTDCQDCFSPGSCIGSTVSNTITETDCECQADCAADARCEFFTFDFGSQICTLRADCHDLASCSTCVSGPKECESLTTSPKPKGNLNTNG